MIDVDIVAPELVMCVRIAPKSRAKLYETITAENWWHPRLKSPSGVERLCVLQWASRLGLSTGQREDPTYTKLRNAVIALYPERTQYNPLGPVASFNDHPDTVFEDMHRVCKFADV